MRGEEAEYIIRYTFRFDRFGMWYLAIRSKTEPTPTDARARCDMLASAVAAARKATGNKLLPGDLGHD
jgi:hypothetical protein